jgi:hypothetical protein
MAVIHAALSAWMRASRRMTGSKSAAPESRPSPGDLDFADPRSDMVLHDQDAPHPPQGTFPAPIGQPYDGLFFPDLSGVSRIRAPDPGRISILIHRFRPH